MSMSNVVLPRPIRALIVAFGYAVGTTAVAAPSADAEGIDFAVKVAPLLASRCGTCHGPDAAESGYRIDQREKAFAGGDSGSAGVVPGKPEESELFVRISTSDKESRMPADGEPLSADEQKLIEEWIAAGAGWPDTFATLPESLLPTSDAKPSKGAGHWAFQPVVRPAVPDGGASSGSSNTIDAFVAAKLAENKLNFNPEADPRSLIRRVSYDLIGLPPTPEEIAAFETACWSAGGIDGPYQELVNRLLASPHYGERWARHWLDVVRFAESDGFETNGARANAWPYRDWVIESFNADKPFDQFVREQVAGDAFGVHPATGFLVGGSKDRVASPDIVLTSNQRADELHDMVSTTASAFLGLTVGCARCHDHKFDPVPQTDYYRIKAVFEGVRHGERPIPNPKEDAERQRQIAGLEREAAAATARLAELLGASQAAGGPVSLRPQVSPQENVDAFPAVRAKFLRFTVLATTGHSQPCIDELEVFATDGTNVARSAKPTASSTLPGHEAHKLEHVNDGQYGNARSWISNESGTGWVQLEFKEPAEIHRIAWSRDRSLSPQFSDRVATRYEVAVSNDGTAWQAVASDKDRIPHGDAPAPVADFASLSPNERAEAEALTAQVAETDKKIKKLKDVPKAYIGVFVQPGKTHRFFRGDPMAPREEIQPGNLTQFGGSWELPGNAPEQDRRRKLAEWIASKDNPLTARVIANRLWHYHFGTGIVDTPSDLGVNGGLPSHPELLDWLAAELVAEGWHLKALHRLIVTSRSYRQSSAARPDALALDSGSRLLWRYPPRRLEAEPLRDSILAVSGALNPKMGGPGFDLFEPNTNYVKAYTTKVKFSDDDFRRMVYQSKPRSELDTFFGAFDCPDAGQVQPKRTVSTTPLQALNMLNGDFLLDQAARFAKRVEQEAGSDPATQVRRAVLLAFGREATAAEIAAGRGLVERYGLPMLCRSLYNASEFITIY
jgi:mono/diheme cytochrome c family protein